MRKLLAGWLWAGGLLRKDAQVMSSSASLEVSFARRSRCRQRLAPGVAFEWGGRGVGIFRTVSGAASARDGEAIGRTPQSAG